MRPTMLALAILLAACGGTDAPTRVITQPPAVSPPATSPPATIAAPALAHLEQVLSLMQTHSVNRTTIDWAAFRREVLNVAAGAQSVADLAPAIRRAIELLADGHTSYRSGTGTFIFVARRSCLPQLSVPPIPVPASIGYVRVGGFSGSAAAAAEFSDAIQASIRAQDSDIIRGWIVDLRSNTGGNMWPMMSGIGPILGTDTSGFFIPPTGLSPWWGYRADGAAVLGGGIMHQASSPYRLRRENPRVAVLTDVGTASSGEAITIAFRTRPRTRSFGQGTCGLSTANSGYLLNDGGLLNLTVAVMADRTRAAYGDRVIPDEVVNETSEVGARAIAWLLSPETP